jgi:outer membrane lipoprotein LolB
VPFPITAFAPKGLGGAVGAIAVLLLSACASLSAPTSVRPADVAADEAFVIDGRLSARRGTDAVTANFTWRHHSPIDELSVTTPLGQEVAELRGDTQAKRVEVRTADGRTDEAPDWSTLTERALGFRLPIDGLAAWVRGTSPASVQATFEYDGAGRARVLRQQGWEIVYNYPDERSRRPSRLRLTYPELEVRLVIDRWQ